FTTVLQHQLLGRSLTVIEQAVFLHKARQRLKELEQEELLALLPMLGHKAKPHILGEFISLLDLEPAVQLALQKGFISQRSAKKLSRFSPTDQQQLAALIEKYQLGGSKQQKLIERCFQLTQREKVSIETLVGRWWEREKDKQLNGPQQTNSLFRWLDQEYQPRLTQAEEEFKKFCSQLHLPAGVRVEHSLSFEEEKVTLSMEFRTKEDLARNWPKIEQLLRKE
ncbi:MAG: hypothetical protein D3910_21370, partial [Candidatus Electrothrix sp. ATG2]|nr:hypothetical protein [Candidatus Electrothrix sp. ATG2]